MANQAQSSNKDASAAAAVAYVRIAKGLRKLGENSLALQVCDKGLARFPNNSNTHVIKGETLIALYNLQNKPESLKAALACLEQALKLDPQNYLAKILSSQIYLKAGARKRAKALLANILKTTPDDERATALMAVIKEKEAKEAAKQEAKEKEERAANAPAAAEAGEKEPAPKAAPEAEPEPAKAEETANEEEYEEPGEVVVSGSLESEEEIETEESGDVKGDTSQWVLDEKVVIGSQEEAEDEYIQEVMSAKLTMFSRLEGLNAIFLLDKDGLPLKIINRTKLDENVIPSLVFNLYKASMNAVRRTGNGSFQRGVLVSPIGTIIIANAFYATLAVIIDNDANLSSVEKRIQRYVEEVTG